MNEQRGMLWRSRWAALGAAVAVSLGAGGAYIATAATSAGSSNFVPIAPCRLTDTRATSTVGTRSTPLAAAETITLAVRGANGNCAIPVTAVGVAMNVTTVDGTAASFLTVWPSDVSPRPTASTNNWVAGAPPTPNKVDVKLSATGSISAFNNVGTVNLVIDVVGFYEPSGVPGYEIATKNVTIPKDSFLGDEVACPTGKKPLSGNYVLTSAPIFGSLRMVQSQIGPTTWGVVIENVGASSVAVTATLQVVCATA